MRALRTMPARGAVTHETSGRSQALIADRTYRTEQTSRGGKAPLRGMLMVLLVLALAACAGDAGGGSTQDERPGADSTPGSVDRATSRELDRGVELDVGDGADFVVRAVVFHPAEEPPEVPDEALLELAGDEGWAVVEDLRGFDLAVVYLTGPFCGFIPEVEVRDDGRPQIIITPTNPLGSDAASEEDHECEDMNFYEAIGFDLVAGTGPDEIEVLVQQP
jgi:hypothetical protein